MNPFLIQLFEGICRDFGWSDAASVQRWKGCERLVRSGVSLARDKLRHIGVNQRLQGSMGH